MKKRVRLAERRAALLHAGAQVSRQISSILDTNRLLSQTVDVICDEFGFYYVGVFLIDETGRWAALRAGRGKAGAAMIAEGHKLEVSGHSMIGAATGERKALIALDVGEEPVHLKNPHLPQTRSEMALPLMVGEEIIGALTVQSVEEAAFSKDDITALQAMADQLAIAINNARLLHDLEVAHANLLRTKTFEAIATATTEAIHWIGNKTMPIPISVARLREDLDRLPQADPALIESIHEDLELIENSARLILAVKEHLIGPAREHEPRPAMLDDVVKDTAVALKIPLEIIRYEVTPDLPLGWVDTTQLSRACGYILKNAMEAVEGMVRPSILVELSPAPDARFVSMRITDTGLGIPTEDLDKIWAAFYTTKGGVQHTGLGLSATWQIIREMGGHAFAANSPRGGASFELLIPAFEGDLPAAPLPTGKSFLLVDDDDPWSRFATETLTASGNTVIRSADGRADPTTFDLILLDDVLEAGSGEAMLKWLKTLDASSKTLVIASSLRVERFMQLMRFGARDVMLKPYTPAALAQIVK